MTDEYVYILYKAACTPTCTHREWRLLRIVSKCLLFIYVFCPLIMLLRQIYASPARTCWRIIPMLITLKLIWSLYSNAYVWIVMCEVSVCMCCWTSAKGSALKKSKYNIILLCATLWVRVCMCVSMWILYYTDADYFEAFMVADLQWVS